MPAPGSLTVTGYKYGAKPAVSIVLRFSPELGTLQQPLMKVVLPSSFSDLVEVTLEAALEGIPVVGTTLAGFVIDDASGTIHWMKDQGTERHFRAWYAFMVDVSSHLLKFTDFAIGMRAGCAIRGGPF